MASARPLRVASVPVVYLVLAVAVTWPLVLVATTEIDIRQNDDPLFIMSQLEWQSYALFNAPGEFFLGNIFYGSGGALFGSDLLLGAVPVFLVLKLVLPNSVAAFNGLYILAFAANATAFYFAFHRLTGNRRAAFVGGLVFAFAPLPLHHSFHVNHNLAWWLPLVLLFGARFGQTLRWKFLAAAVLCVWLAFVTTVHYAFMSSIVLLVFGIVPAVVRTWRRREYRWVLPALTAVILISIPFVPVVLSYLDFSSAWGIERSAGEMQYYSSQPADYLSPGDRMRWYGGLAERYPRQSPERTLFPGFVPIVLALAGGALGLGRADRSRGIAVAAIALTAAALLLSFGLRVTWPRLGLDIPLPMEFLREHFTVFRSIRVMARYSLLLNFGLAILAGVALCRAHQLSVRGLSRHIPVLFVTAALLAEAWPNPLPTIAVPSHPALQSALYAAPRGAVVFVPVEELVKSGGSDLVWLNTLAKGGPSVSGASGIVWPQVARYAKALDRMSSAEVADTLAALTSAGIRHIIIDDSKISTLQRYALAGVADQYWVESVTQAQEFRLVTLKTPTAPAIARWLDLGSDLLINRMRPGERLIATLVFRNDSGGPWIPLPDSRYRDIILTWHDATGSQVLTTTYSFLPPPFLASRTAFSIPVTIRSPGTEGEYQVEVQIDGEVVAQQSVVVETIRSFEFDGTAQGLKAEIQLASPSEFTVFPGEEIPIRVNVFNQGTVRWFDPEVFRLGGRFQLIGNDGALEPVGEEWRIMREPHVYGGTNPGQGYSFAGRVKAPMERGSYIVTASAVAELVAWFDVEPVKIMVHVVSGD